MKFWNFLINGIQVLNLKISNFHRSKIDFLDIHIEIIDDKITTGVFRKEIFPPKYLRFESSLPGQYKKISFLAFYTEQKIFVRMNKFIVSKKK